jgi:phosphoglycerate kinase
MFGYLMAKEIKSMDRLLKENEKPFTLLLGGNNNMTKINVIETLLPNIDNLLIGGALAFPFLAAKGYKTGNIALESEQIEIASRIIMDAKMKGVEIVLPQDFVVAENTADDAFVGICDFDEIKREWLPLDIGIKTVDEFIEIIKKSKTLMWDGPMGMYEKPRFAFGTLKVALAIGIATDKGLYSVVGGGDTITAVNKCGFLHKMSYISSAGGALLEYVEKRTLPAIKAIKESTSIEDYDFAGKRALIRVDFNVPLNDKFEVIDNTRIYTATPSIQKVLSDGGSIILLTHLGRPKGVYEEKYSVKHIVPTLTKQFGVQVKFCPDIVGEKAEKMAAELKPGEIMILENLRFDSREVQNDEKFAAQLAKLGDVYIMNAFGTAHRAHASTYMIAKFFPNDKMLGYLVESEIRNINRVLHKAERPFTAIVGGAKVSTKIDIIKALLLQVDNLIIGGGISYSFIKAMGGQIGNSLVEDNSLEVAQEIIELAKKQNVRLYLPIDCIIADKFDNDAKIKQSKIGEIPQGWKGMDIGILTAEAYSNVIENSKTILWNGPMGVFELEHFCNGTIKIALAVARATEAGAFSLVGGGDSIAALNKYGLANSISYISTAGGALLEYIEGKDLPSLKAIRTKI